MLKNAQHRGPDSFGTLFSDGNRWKDRETDSAWIGLGHVRLSVIDLSDTSAQPIISQCGRFVLAFNCEIYNYLELRSELVDLGRAFTSRGDSEVLLQGLIQWGAGVLPRLWGMFSFVFVHLKDESVVAARDLYGIKPLYLWREEQNFHFAITIKQFLGDPKWKALLNQKVVLEYLLYRVTEYSASKLFQDVEHIPPGSVGTLNRSLSHKLQVKKWWNPQRASFEGTYEDASERYQHLFRQSLDIHLRSDVAIASRLSGGLDSSAIVVATSKWFDKNRISHHTFTATSDDHNLVESHYARAVSDFSSSTGHELLPTSERLWKELDQIIWHQDEPFGSTSVFAQSRVFSAMADQGIKDALDSPGADEQLDRYNSFVSLHIVNQIMRGRFISAQHSFKSFNNSGGVTTNSIHSVMAYTHLPKSLRGIAERFAKTPPQNGRNWLNPRLVDGVGVQYPRTSSGKYPQTVNELSREMVDYFNLPKLLRFEDRNSMAVGIEARVPFVDYELMEFVLTLPEEYLLRYNNLASVLRDSVADCLPQIYCATSEQHWTSNRRKKLVGEPCQHNTE